MKNQFRIAALAALVAAGALAGCRSSVNTVDPANPKGTPSPEAMNHTITDSSLGDAVVPIFYSKGKTPAGFTIMQLRVQNQTRSVARVNYRVEWFETNGISVTNTPISKPLAIEPGAVQTVAVTAPTENAVDATVSFQESKNN